jgi:NAD(P)-dependent dehydrogenase (short-subunit alcohol dehydrogenase family)
MATENDIAPVVLALVSSDFNYVTGQTIMVDGGAAVLR